MKLFAAETSGVWLGAYTVIVAHDEDEARRLLTEELERQHLSTKNVYEFKELDISEPKAVVLFDGDY